MVRPQKTRSTSLGEERLYLDKAEKFLQGAQLLLEKSNWEGAASLGIHAIISSCDSLTAKFLNVRHAGQDHQGVLELLKSLPFPGQRALNEMIRRIAQVLTSKTNIEYSSKPIRPNDARAIVSEAEKIVSWAHEHVK